MSKRTVFTTISPLPAGLSRQVVLAFLHNHLELIDLNPLVKERHPIAPPPQYIHEDEKNCVWYSLTDHIDYLPGGKVSGDISYTCSFHDLRNGIQTHCRAGFGVEIREKWTLCGSLPGEPPEPVELGLGAPSSGLYIREDCDLRCNILMTSFVKKNLKRAHAVLVQRLVEKSRVVSGESGSVTLAMLWTAPSYPPSGLSTDSSAPSPSSPPLPHIWPASFSGYTVVEVGRTSPPQSGVNTVAGGRQPTDSFLAFQDDQLQEHNRERAPTESSRYRPYSQYDICSQPPTPRQFPLALRVPAGPPPPPSAPQATAAERPENNYTHQSPQYAPPRPPKHVDPALYPTPLRIRGLSVGSNTTVSSNASTGAASPSARTHASSVCSVSCTHTDPYYSLRSRASMPPVPVPAARIIAPPEQHPEYPVMNPYSGPASTSSSGASSPADDMQPNTPRFSVGLVGSSAAGAGDERKYGRAGLRVAEHPAILRPGFGAGRSSRLSGPFLAELE